MGNQKLLLASKSPRRQELLKSLDLDFEIAPSATDEVFRENRTPMENALDVAREKAEWAAQKYPEYFVIGADTIVVLDDKIIGKPTDRKDAHRILNDLSGDEHLVITAVVIINPKGEKFEEAAVSKVKIKPLTHAEIADYIDTGESMDKAGAYAIQGKGAFLVEAYSGSYSNIVGLPLDTVKSLLEKSGYRMPSS